MKTIWQNLKEITINTFNTFGLAWWVEITTQNPCCTYYFGPFLNSAEAKLAIKGYVEDLETEGAQGIGVNVKRCKPNNLTIAEDLGERLDRKVKPAFSGQM
ncbi:DUF1816 domain-containing protein [Anabaena sp. FACHB-709]|uniref:DUF1816 domain-containing protein n=2 Tax=Nostocaceae TaxID=1162 RepID=A0A1Z4KSX7_ANAVA|nr:MULTISPECIES: DUF1816 domain-containing protein [Nostocaceae]BAY72135.1 hypothetical protein NIES23_49590 [Trichormus variabilis NIES-23]HBW28830.1 DUF1816 domain-containing protein [Nostoc sp. UBA8866]MBD2171429.1 DUF1816 domain-containing protein [Anabaena cylindrica FACHB-318]MBD2263212.1 DUF1816 domain-containing protein [Anabaena sp. FACHB-709]MBD2272757.1 DUF1816 domain-containing protein [Nostoc sp. PCC 7120 = FACHB-418]